MASTSVAFDIIARDRASNVFGKVGKSADQSQSKFKKFGGGVAKAAKFAAVGMAAAGAATAVVGKKLVDAGERAGTSNARIEQIAKSMKLFGNETDTVSKRLVKLAEKQAMRTGVDQNAIKESQALLLTFKNVAKTADEAGGAFDRTSKVVQDLSAAGYGDLSSISKQVGKAMNDPIKGLDGLSRAGVQFTDAQKNVIRNMVKGGDMAGAQAKILSELETQVGGVAEATANGTDRMKVAFSQVTEQIGMKLVPVVDRLADWFIGKALPAMQEFGGWLQTTLPPIFDRVRDVIAQFTGDGSGKFSKFVADVKGIFNDFVTIVTALWDLFGDNILTHAKRMFNAVKQVIGGAFKVIKGIFQVFAGILTGDWKKTWKGIKNILSGAKDILIGIVKALWATVKFAFSNAKVVMSKIMSAAWDGIKALFRNGKDAIIDGVKAIPGKIREVGGKMLEAGKSIMGKLFDGIKQGASAVGGFVSDFASRIASAIKGAANTALGLPKRITLGGKLGIPEVGFTIPAFQRGGVVKARPGGTLALIAEGGHDEAVVPLSGPHAPRAARSGDLAVGGGTTFVFAPRVTGAVDPIATTRQLERMFIKYAQSVGRPVKTA